MLAEKLSGAVGNAANPTYIEDVFSTYLYAGTSATQNIVNGIDLSTKGGLFWAKDRTSGSSNNVFIDSARGVGNELASNLTAAQTSQGLVTSFNIDGVSLSSNNSIANINRSGENYVSWTFRKQPKFFDIVTYTGNGAAGRQISHNLGSTPGCIIVKTTTGGNGWLVWHKDLGSNSRELLLNSSGTYTSYGYFGGAPTSTTFTVDGVVGNGTNTNGETFVAYLFAHDAGGFGLTGTDNVISCGSFAGASSTPGPLINLGWEPQWILFKKVNSAQDWFIQDNMRGMPNGSSAKGLRPNLPDAEIDMSQLTPTATGFFIGNALGTTSDTYIYIAIRRGPMKVPTDATKVFNPQTRTGNGSITTITGLGLTPDFVFSRRRSNCDNGVESTFWDRLRGANQALNTLATSAEAATTTNLTGFDVQDGITVGAGNGTPYSINFNTLNYANFYLKRAPSFFDEVCYTGTGSVATINHNLGAVPELIIFKRRNATSNWPVYAATSGQGYLLLNYSDPYQADTSFLNNTTPTSTVFTLGADAGSGNPDRNVSGATYVAYLFATCAGVSKVGSYSGTGATQTISCGFTGGARFVMIKRTDGLGDWYVWDTARGMVAGTDPSLLLNSTAAEVNANSIYTTTGGFQIVSTATGINSSGKSYIFLAIA